MEAVNKLIGLIDTKRLKRASRKYKKRLDKMIAERRTPAPLFDGKPLNAKLEKYNLWYESDFKDEPRTKITREVYKTIKAQLAESKRNPHITRRSIAFMNKVSYSSVSRIAQSKSYKEYRESRKRVNG